jgi:hypothetical protein
MIQRRGIGSAAFFARYSSKQWTATAPLRSGESGVMLARQVMEWPSA